MEADAFDFIGYNPPPPQAATLMMLKEPIFFASLADQLSFVEVGTLASLHPEIAVTAAKYIENHYNSLLSSFFSRPTAFRAAMREKNAVISGSTALRFINRDEGWESGDMDIYVPLDNAHGMKWYLLNREGYRFVSETEEWADSVYGDSRHGVNRVIKLKKGGVETEDSDADDQDQAQGQGQVQGQNQPQNDNQEGEHMDVGEADTPETPVRSIDIIVSRTDSPIVPITKFHSTIVMNYLSADLAVSLYPHHLQQRIFVAQHVGRNPRRQDLWEAKYSARGYRFYRTTTAMYIDGKTCGAACPALQRKIFDDDCWVAPLGPSGLSWFMNMGRHDPNKGVEWKLCRFDRGEICWNHACKRNLISNLETTLERMIEAVTPMPHGTPEEEDSDDDPMGAAINAITRRQHAPVTAIDFLRSILNHFTTTSLAALRAEKTLHTTHTLLEAIVQLHGQRLVEARANLGMYEYVLHGGQDPECRTKEFFRKYERAQAEHEIQLKKVNKCRERYNKLVPERMRKLLELRGKHTLHMDRVGKEDKSSISELKRELAGAVKEIHSIVRDVIQCEPSRYLDDDEDMEEHIWPLTRCIEKQLYEGLNIAMALIDRQLYMFQVANSVFSRSRTLWSEVESLRLKEYHERKLEDVENDLRWEERSRGGRASEEDDSGGDEMEEEGSEAEIEGNLDIAVLTEAEHERLRELEGKKVEYEKLYKKFEGLEKTYREKRTMVEKELARLRRMLATEAEWV